MDLFKNVSNFGAVRILVGNKADKASSRQVNADDAR